MAGENDLRSPDVAVRLGALRGLCAELPGRARRGVNLHLHTNESFSSFESPSEAVWQAAREGLLAVGINDHYTVAGHREFREACRCAGLAATFSMEAVALDGEAARGGLRINDPSNPGRAYLCAKGITRTPAPQEEAAVQLDGLRRAIGRRNREMTLRAGRVFAERLGAAGPRGRPSSV